VAELQMGSGPAQITRFDRRRSVTIKAEVGGAPIGAIDAAVDQLPAMKNLPGDVKRLRYGDAERMQELFADFGVAIIAGVLLVYCVLVLLFHDFAQPVTIMAALPLSVGGALGMLLLAGEAMSLQERTVDIAQRYGEEDAATRSLSWSMPYLSLALARTERRLRLRGVSP